MSMLVLIRNIEEMDTALEAANKHVIFMQKLFDSNQKESSRRNQVNMHRIVYNPVVRG